MKKSNGFERSRKELADTVKAVGGVFNFNPPVKVTIIPFGERLNGGTRTHQANILSVSTITGHLCFMSNNCGAVGVCTSDFYDGNDFKTLNREIKWRSAKKQEKGK